MRTVIFAIASFSMAGFRFCGADEPPPPPGSVTVVADAPGLSASAATSLSFAPRHGGQVASVDDYAVEVVPHESGHVHAYVHGDVAAPEALEMAVEVSVEGGRKRPVRMRWNADELRYEGEVRRVAIVPGPVDVVVTAQGRRTRGGVVVVGLAPPIHVDVVVAEPRVDVRVIEPRIEVRHYGKHRKHGKYRRHGKHRGRGRGRGHGHGGRAGIDVRVY